MASMLEFKDHETFHRAFARMAAAGLASALVCQAVASPASASPGPMGGSFRLAAVGTAVIAAAVWPRWCRAGRRSRLAVVLFTMAAAALVISSTQPLALAGAALAAGGILLWGVPANGPGRTAERSTGSRGAVIAGVVIAATAMAVAAAAFDRMSAATLFHAAPAAVPAALSGLGFGIIAVLAQLPGHLLFVPDRVGAAHARVSPRARGEIRDLSDRALALWRKTEASLPATDQSRAILEEGVLRLFEVAGRWSDVEAESATAEPDALTRRIGELDARIAAATDEVVRGAYASAREALREQLRYLEDIGASRERVLARMHNYLAAMERLELALVNVKSTSASNSAVDVQPMIESIADLGRDIDTLSETLDD